MHLKHHQSPSDLDQARRCLLEIGEVPGGLVDDTLNRSWQRSRHAGISPVDSLGGPPLCSSVELKQALACHHDFLAHARPVMEFVFDQIRDSGSLVVLSDCRGLLLHSMGDTDFISRAERVSLLPGALWHEVDRGTNAIGTALAEERAVVIHGAEHYLERNSFLTCSAAPVRGPNGRLKGVLDISGDRRGYHPHTFALVRSAARMIEDRLFHARHYRDLIMRMHPYAEGLGGVGEGLLALSEDGWVVGANALAQQWLALSESQIGACTLEQATGSRLGLWPPGRVMRLATRDSLTLFARLDGRQREVVNVPARGHVRPAVPESRSEAAPYTPYKPDGALREQATPASKKPSDLAPSPHRTRASDRGHTAAFAAHRAPQAVGTTPAVRRQDDLRIPAVAASGAIEHEIDPRLLDALHRAQRVQAQGIAVLIQGESGTGKEVFARTLHAEGERAHKPFVAVNCAALPETLIEAELFGYTGGAFTGARREGSPGRIREADGGTLFLDEIGDMPLSLQARLLRVLQDKMVVPLGGSKPVPVDFVLVCATHRKLKDAIASGDFREDLYYRLNGLTVTLPALRERQDFRAVLRQVLDQITQGMNRPPVDSIHPGLLQALARHSWPGNLRQLHGLLRTACALLERDEYALDWPHLPDDMVAELRTSPAHALAASNPHGHAQAGSHLGHADAHTRGLQDAPFDTPHDGAPTPSPEANLKRLSSLTIQQVIQATEGNMSEAARRLGISRNTLYRRIKQDQAA
jgi:transcriptional regulator of acetoin/glycerol metabolism